MISRAADNSPRFRPSFPFRARCRARPRPCLSCPSIVRHVTHTSGRVGARLRKRATPCTRPLPNPSRLTFPCVYMQRRDVVRSCSCKFNLDGFHTVLWNGTGSAQNSTGCPANRSQHMISSTCRRATRHRRRPSLSCHLMCLSSHIDFMSKGLPSNAYIHQHDVRTVSRAWSKQSNAPPFSPHRSSCTWSSRLVAEQQLHTHSALQAITPHKCAATCISVECSGKVSSIRRPGFLWSTPALPAVPVLIAGSKAPVRVRHPCVERTTKGLQPWLAILRRSEAQSHCNRRCRNQFIIPIAPD
jgi:hypothetical protein